MAVTNEFERDLVNQAHLKHPGRIDMIVFQNLADVGDGSPGIQRCFRNYLHEGGMEKDLQLVGYGIKGTSVDINNAELQQLSNIGASVITTSIWTQLSNIGASVISSNEWSQIANIGAVTINVTQWGYLGALNQGLTQTSNVTFNSLGLTTTLTMSGNIIMGSDDITFTAGGLVDGVDVGSHAHSGAGQGGTVSYANLSNRAHTLSGVDHTGDLIYTQLDSIVDTSGGGSSILISRADHVHTSSDGSTKVTHSNLSSIGVSDHHTKYTDANAKAAAVDNTAFANTWNGVNDEAPSKNTIWDGLMKGHYGTYTGNGSTSKTITVGNNMIVIFVMVYRYTASEHDLASLWFKSNGDSIYAFGFENNSDYWKENRINTLSTNYFQVDDGGGDFHPNSNGEVYHYFAWCQNTN